MTPEAAHALELSIARWERIAEGKESMDEGECALCEVFPSPLCEGCPVQEHTRQPQCHKTPYYDARYLLRMVGPGSGEFRGAALAEVEFLKSLRQPPVGFRVMVEGDL